VAKDWEIVLIKKYKTRKETLEIEKSLSLKQNILR